MRICCKNTCFKIIPLLEDATLRSNFQDGRRGGTSQCNMGTCSNYLDFWDGASSGCYIWETNVTTISSFELTEIYGKDFSRLPKVSAISMKHFSSIKSCQKVKHSKPWWSLSVSLAVAFFYFSLFFFQFFFFWLT